MKDELGRKIMTKLASLRPKIYSSLADDGYVHKKGKRYKKVCNKTNTCI